MITYREIPASGPRHQTCDLCTVPVGRVPSGEWQPFYSVPNGIGKAETEFCPACFEWLEETFNGEPEVRSDQVPADADQTGQAAQ
jgi:hypothetical protein